MCADTSEEDVEGEEGRMWTGFRKRREAKIQEYKHGNMIPSVPVSILVGYLGPSHYLSIYLSRYLLRFARSAHWENLQAANQKRGLEGIILGQGAAVEITHRERGRPTPIVSRSRPSTSKISSALLAWRYRYNTVSYMPVVPRIHQII